jgi:hypothetical protein
MKDIDTVAKRGVNDFHRYRYATMGDILKEVTPLLGRHGLAIFQSETGRAMFDGENVIAIEYAFTVGPRERRDVAPASASERRLQMPRQQGRLGRQVAQQVPHRSAQVFPALAFSDPDRRGRRRRSRRERRA